jgi:hypothetical protein
MIGYNFGFPGVSSLEYSMLPVMRITNLVMAIYQTKNLQARMEII